MKLSSFVALSATVAMSLGAVLAQGKPVLRGMIVKADGSTLTSGLVYIEKISGADLTYKESESSKTKKVKVASQKSVYIVRPAEYTVAMEFFENRKYEAALKSFQDVKLKYKSFSDIKNSIPALAGFYELACLRKLKRYEDLAKAQKAFKYKSRLTKKADKQQLEIYELWALLQGEKGYEKVIEKYDSKWEKAKLPLPLRAQVEFILAEAKLAAGQTDEAVDAYYSAMVADSTSSEVITLESIESIFSLLEADEELQAFRKAWDGGDTSQKNSLLHRRLKEAAGIVASHDHLGLSGYDSTGSAKKLPAKISAYSKYVK